MAAQEGMRKDCISHGIKSAILKAGGYPTYFNEMRQKLPTKFADMVSKYIPQEIEQTLNLNNVNVLQVVRAEPRAVEPTKCEVLDVVSTDECKADSTVECDDE